MDEVNKNIYLSFDWNIKEQAKVLNQKLTDLGYTIFTSESIRDDQLSDDLVDSIKKSNIFICCLTQEYCKSKKCNLEILNADYHDKQKFVLMLENIDIVNDIDKIEITNQDYASPIGFIIK